MIRRHDRLPFFGKKPDQSDNDSALKSEKADQSPKRKPLMMAGPLVLSNWRPKPKGEDR